MPTAIADEHTIREQAYYFWEADGRPPGRETEFWMRAVAALNAPPTKPAKAKAIKVATKQKAAASKTKAEPAKRLKAAKPAGKTTTKTKTA